MRYELELFNRIITGDLAPHNILKNEASEIKTYVSQYQTVAYKRYSAKFVNTENNYTHLTFNELGFQDINLNEGKQDTEILHNNLPCGLLDICLEKLDVKETQIIHSHFNSTGIKTSLDMVIKFDITDLKHHDLIYLYYEKLLQNDFDKTVMNFFHIAFTLRSETEIRLYIQNHQFALEKLVASVVTILKNNKPLPSLNIAQTNKVIHLIWNYLDLLIVHLEENFYFYLDLNRASSRKKRNDIHTEMITDISKSKKYLLHCSIDEPYKRILANVLEKANKIKENLSVSYNEGEYLKLLIIELSLFLAENNDKVNINDLHTFLLSLNFNSNTYFRLFTQAIAINIEELNDEGKIDLLLWYMKNNNQVTPKTKKAYDLTLSPIKEQIKHWIEEEIYYINSRKSNSLMLSGKKQETTKTLVNLSVPQLAYALRLLVDTNIINSNNLSAFFRIVSKNISTANTAFISPESLSAKYYDAEQRSRDKVKEALINLLNAATKRE